MLVCRDVSEMTTDYLEHALPWRKWLAMRWHLNICDLCRRHLRQVRQTVKLLHVLPPVPVPVALEDHLIAEASGTRRPPDPAPS